MKLYLVRHTRPEVASGVCYGQADIGLADSYDDELQTVLKKLPEEYGVVYSSPLLRCNILAKSIANGAGVITDANLVEIDFGQWEMMSWDQIDKDVLMEWGNDFVNRRVPEGENFMDVIKRSSDFLSHIQSKKTEKATVVTHAGVIRAILSLILEVPPRKAFAIKIPYSCVVELTIGDNDFYEIQFL